MEKVRRGAAMVWVEDLYAFSTHSPWCLSERKSRMDTGQGPLTLQGFEFTNKEDKLGPAPTLEASLWTTWKFRLQKSLVCKYHTVIPPSDLTLSSLCLYICKKGHGMAEHLSSEQLKHVACQVCFSAHSLP